MKMVSAEISYLSSVLLRFKGNDKENFFDFY